MEALLVNAVQKKDYSEELENVLDIYSSDLYKSNLEVQLNILSCTVPKEVSNISDIKEYLQQLSKGIFLMKSLF